MSAPLFSVLIANYNNGRFLQEAIDSVLAQTYTHWEVVIVDDKSNDISFEVYEKYKNDERFHFYYNESNMGCGYTKHRCVELANGEVCGFLDPDDALMPKALEVTIQSFSKRPNVVLSFSRHYICDEKMNIVKESRPLVLKNGESYFEHHDYCAEHFAGISREAFLRVDGIDPTLKAGVDADLYFRMEEAGNIEISHEILYKYRIFDKSITSHWTKAFYWNLIVRHNTCIRRGLPVEKYSFRDFLNFISYSHWNTRSYRLGKLILNPISWVKYKRKTKG